MPLPPQNIPFLAGIIVGLSCRAFIYFLLITAYWRFGGANLTPDLGPLVPVTYWTLVFSSPLWVPFVSGFLSAYFWRRLSNEHYFAATRFVMAAVGSVLLLWACFLRLAPVSFMGLVLVYVDERLGADGMEHGERFWNRQRAQLTRSSTTLDDKR